MKFKQAQLFRFDLPLVKALPIDSDSLIRSGFILNYTTPDGRVLWSEASPLPGWHKETLQEAQEQILSDDDTEILFPSVRMALDLLQWQLEGNGSAKLSDIQLRALCDTHRDNLESWTAWALRQDYQGIKIKVGRLPIEKELDVIRTVRNMVGPHFEITLDANQKFELSEAVEFAKACESLRIAYIEEPVKNVDDIMKFYSATGMPVALDESLELALPVSVWIIKPSCVGGLTRLREISEQAQRRNIKLVFSSTFESKVGISLWMQLAAAYGTPGVAHGLDTLMWFAEDLSGNNCKLV